MFKARGTRPVRLALRQGETPAPPSVVPKLFGIRRMTTIERLVAEGRIPAFLKADFDDFSALAARALDGDTAAIEAMAAFGKRIPGELRSAVAQLVSEETDRADPDGTLDDGLAVAVVSLAGRLLRGAWDTREHANVRPSALFEVAGWGTA